MRESNNKNHYWMAAVEVTYVRPETEEEIASGGGKAKVKRLNVVFQNSKKIVSYSVLNQARKGVVLRMNNEFQISPAMLRDVVFLGMSYLGVMSDKEFNDHEDEIAAAQAASH